MSTLSTIKPKAIIVDLDGTLAIHQGRDPFDLAKVKTDLVNPPIAAIIRHFQHDTLIIIMSGREAICQEDTEAWLDENAIHYDEIYMRPKGDYRKDAVVKGELYDAHVRDKYDVLFCLDDRNQVVDLWRSMGLVCFQVAPGDF